MQIETIKIYDTLDLSERRLPLMRVQGKAEGATLWLVANAHGNEVIGIEVIHRVMAILRQTPLDCGTVYAMPMLNPMANELMWRNTPQDNDNLNRRYPGNAHGGFTERLAHTIYQTILSKGADVVLDLHTMGLTRTLPFIILDRPTDPALKQPLETLADIFGITVVYDYSAEEYAALQLDGSLSGTLLNVSNILSMTVELGPKDILIEEFVEAGVQGVLNVMSHLKMLKATPKAHASQIKSAYPMRRDASIRATKTGIIDFLVRPGDAIEAGQPLVRIKNIIGEEVERIQAAQDGYILALLEKAVAFPGFQLIQFALKEGDI